MGQQPSRRSLQQTSSIATDSPPTQRSSNSIQQKFLNIWDNLDFLGRALMGDLWRTVYLSIQDAIALSVLLQVPGLIGSLILGKSFSSFDVCLKENPFGVNRYACFVIVTSDFFLWIVLTGRILGHFVGEVSRNFKSKRKGTQNGSSRP
jgi:hypothetical protein